jgi:hypothetical protein
MCVISWTFVLSLEGKLRFKILEKFLGMLSKKEPGMPQETQDSIGLMFSPLAQISLLNALFCSKGFLEERCILLSCFCLYGKRDSPRF